MKSCTLDESDNSGETKMMFGDEIVRYTGQPCIR